jgi:hypothetical protein
MRVALGQLGSLRLLHFAAALGRLLDISASTHLGAALGLAASSAKAHRRGPLPHRRYPSPAASPAHPPLRILGDPTCTSGQAVILTPGILSPRKLAVKGAPDGRVPPLRSEQTLDCELPRQVPGTCQEDERRIGGPGPTDRPVALGGRSHRT